MRSFIKKTILVLTVTLLITMSYNTTYAYDLGYDTTYAYDLSYDTNYEYNSWYDINYEKEIYKEDPIKIETNKVQVNKEEISTNRGEINREEIATEVISFSNEELYLLSKLITGEARGESYEGQLAVAAVVINRVQDPRFPKTIKDVIYQPRAFSAVSDGQINLEPTDTSMKAATEALKGQDPTEGAVFYWNPDIATCNWIKTLKPYGRIGNHVFAK